MPWMPPLLDMTPMAMNKNTTNTMIRAWNPAPEVQTGSVSPSPSQVCGSPRMSDHSVSAPRCQSPVTGDSSASAKVASAPAAPLPVARNQAAPASDPANSEITMRCDAMARMIARNAGIRLPRLGYDHSTVTSPSDAATPASPARIVSAIGARLASTLRAPSLPPFSMVRAAAHSAAARTHSRACASETAASAGLTMYCTASGGMVPAST